MVLAAGEVMGLTIGEWKDIADAIASVVTFVAILVGGWWTWRRFRRTPESRAKISLDVSPSWQTPKDGSDQYVTAKVTAANQGGRTQHLLVDDGAAEPSVVACWALTSEAAARGACSAGYVDWTMTPANAAPLLSQAVQLRPNDTWDETVLFPLPADAEAARISVQLFVGAEGTVDNTISASSVIARPRKEE
jgi:hypothetical protein